MVEATLVFVLKDGKVLLGEKTQKYCKGKLVAPGGKVEPHEDVCTAAVRETIAECGLRPVLSPTPLGIVTCHNHGSYGTVRISVFRTGRFTGEVRDSNELVNLAWYPIHAIPHNRMMDGDRGWLGHVLRNEAFETEVRYDEEWRVFHAWIRPK